MPLENKIQHYIYWRDRAVNHPYPDNLRRAVDALSGLLDTYVASIRDYITAESVSDNAANRAWVICHQISDLIINAPRPVALALHARLGGAYPPTGDEGIDADVECLIADLARPPYPG